MDVNRKTHPDCKYSTNPFHECASDCLEKIAKGGGKKHSKKQGAKILSLTGSFGKKKTESHPQSPLNTRQYHNNAANSPKIHQSRPSKKPVPPSPNTIADGSKTASPRTQEREQSSKNDTASEISVLNVVSPPRSYNNDDDDENNDDENVVELDLESVMSDSCVSVGKYRVNLSVSSILRSIIDKHGDIAENCRLESASMRSRYLECLCSLMQELGSTKVGQLTELKVKEMLAVLKDLESVNIDVVWLRSVLEEFAQYQENTDSEKKRQEESVRSKNEELEIQEADLARIEKEATETRLRVEGLKMELATLETEWLRMEEMGFKVEKFKGKSFLDELL